MQQGAQHRQPPLAPGRKPVPARRVLDAVLWILTTGAQWHLLPQSYPNYKTVHRRFQAWARHDILRGILVDLANELRERDLLDTTECYIDATFANGRGGGLEIGNTKCGKGVKIMAIVDRAGLPLSVSTHAANHHEVKLVQLSFDFYMIEAMPDVLIGDPRRSYFPKGELIQLAEYEVPTTRELEDQAVKRSGVYGLAG